MADSLEIPTLDLTRDDGLAHMKATHIGLPGHVANIGIESYRKERGLSREKIYEELGHYSSLSQNKGRISFLLSVLNTLEFSFLNLF